MVEVDVVEVVVVDVVEVDVVEAYLSRWKMKFKRRRARSW